jgi:hypothetical protein
MSDTQWLTIKPREILAWDREAREFRYLAEVPCSFTELVRDDRYLSWMLSPNVPQEPTPVGYVVCALRGDIITPLRYVYGKVGPGEYDSEGTKVMRRHVRFSGGVHVAL